MLKFCRKTLGFALFEGLLLLLIVSILAAAIVFALLNYTDFLPTTKNAENAAHVSANIFNNITVPSVKHEEIIINLDDDKPLQTATIAKKIFFPFTKEKKVATEWPIGRAGFLVKSYDGVNLELLGYRYQKASKVMANNGYEALLDLDVNQDNRLEKDDVNYPYLYVWLDTNQNGILNDGELFSLESLGISTIVIDSMQTVNQKVNNSVITKKGYYLRKDGSKGSILDVDLFQDPFYRQFTTPIKISDSVKDIPNILGSGFVRDLQEAATQSSHLLLEVNNFFASTSADRQYNMMDSLLFEWARTLNSPFLVHLIKYETNYFKLGLNDDLRPTQYSGIESNTNRIFNNIMVIEQFTGQQQLYLFAKEVLNSETGQRELHLAISLNNQIIARSIVKANNNQKIVLISDNMLSFTAEQTIAINQQYEAIKKNIFDKLQKEIKDKLQKEVDDKKQIVTQSDPTKNQWIDAGLQQQINTGQYFKKKGQPIDYPRRRHLSECVKPDNVIDQQVRDCAAGKIAKTW